MTPIIVLKPRDGRNRYESADHNRSPRVLLETHLETSRVCRPGELKAFETVNVYDTATGQVLLIPQGSRLVGKYDSRVTYGQSSVQVVWSRIIFPGASSVDLNGMEGLD